ncbi:sulfatase [Streptomyces spongiae]|uniref:Sulfatase n=1 Tax=Streptomyces spongiae TaxID=565072 RepID=A0A5N8XNN6_9ACTN|nr:sulfatase [Streptomyces spongiae]MPY60668.1 sulfatase [Streptomyces spongiae]
MSHTRTSQLPAEDEEAARASGETASGKGEPADAGTATEKPESSDAKASSSDDTDIAATGEPEDNASGTVDAGEPVEGNSGEDARVPDGTDGDAPGKAATRGPVEADGRTPEEADTATAPATATTDQPDDTDHEPATDGAKTTQPPARTTSDGEVDEAGASGRVTPDGRTPEEADTATAPATATTDQPDDTDHEPTSSGTEAAQPTASDTADGDASQGDTAAGGEGATPDVARGWRGRRPVLARALSWTVTGLALVLVLFVLVLPNDVSKLEPERFVRIPAEGVLGAALLLLLPPRTRKLMAVVEGVALGLLVILKALDMGFYWTLDRPFDLVLDWILLDDAQSFVKDSFGEGGALAATIGLIVLLAGLVVLLVLSVLRLTRVMVDNRHTTGRTLLVLGTAWITCSTLTLEFSGVPVASHSSATLVENRVEAVRTGLKDGKAFEKQAAIDAFADVPPDQLLTGLRGKDVLITFIESYGRSAIDDPQMGVPLGKTLAQKTQELKDAGYASRSGWLRSPITGAGSWLGHSTFLSGLWIKNQSRYANLVASDRLTLTEAFRRTGAWRTVGIVPGTQKAWPEGKYFGLNHIYDSDQLGYKGPKFSWSTMPDQYTLKAFEKLEHGKKDRKPMMAEIILTSSHNPWAPIPSTIPEDQIGDGSVYHDLQKREGKNPEEVWKDASKVRDEYRKSIQYSVTSLVDYVAKYGSKDTVLVFLGDHQPNKTVTGEKPNYDVPVSIVAQDPKVLDKIADWNWTDGLKPADNAPEWRMDKFRDRFMTAFGPQAGGDS